MMNTTRVDTTTPTEAAAVQLLLDLGLVRIADEMCEYITTYRADDDIDVMIAETAAALEKAERTGRTLVGVEATTRCFPVTERTEHGLMVVRLDDLYAIIKGEI